MDPSIMKLLEEDDDETLHSGADLEAFQTALNRDIAGDTFLSPPSSESCNGLEFHKDDVNAASEDTRKQQQEVPKMDLKPDVALPDLKNGGSSKVAIHLTSQENFLYRKGPENALPIAQADGATTCKKDSIRFDGIDWKPTPDLGNDSQYLMLQKMSNQDTNLSRKQTSQVRSGKQVPFTELLPFIVPLLDKDRALQLTTLYEKLKRNDYPRNVFIKNMRGIVGDQILKLAVARVNAQSINQQRKVSVQTSTQTPQNLSVKKETIDVTTCNRLHPLLPQKRKMVDTHSGPSSFRVHPATERSIGSKTELHSQASHPSPTLSDVKIPFKMQSNGLKNPVEKLNSSTSAGSKKQKVSVSCDGPSIAELIDVTTSTINLREEEEQLLSGSNEHTAVSEASIKAVQVEEQKLILQKDSLHKKVAQIMAKCGVTNMSKDVERCISMGVEERVGVLLCNLIRFSKQRVDVEKQRHQTVLISDIHQHLMILNRKAKDLWIQKQEAQKRSSEESSSGGVDGDKEKEEGRGKSLKAAINKEEDEKMRTTAANAAARVAVGGDDHLSKWQLMAEQARQKRQSGEGSLEMGNTSGRGGEDSSHTKNQSSPTAIRRKNPSQRSIGVRDVIAVLERESQMSKSTLLYNLYNTTHNP